MKYLKFTFSLLIFIAISITAYQVVQNSHDNQQYKKDHAELNHFKYGLFNMDTWKKQISIIVMDEIDKLSLKGSNQSFLKRHLERQLAILIEKVNQRIKARNMKTMKGQLKQTMIEVFVDIEDIKAGIPDYAKAMLGEMSSPKTEKKFKSMLKEKVSNYLSETFDNLPTDSKLAIIAKYSGGNEEGAKRRLNELMISKQKQIEWQSQLILFLAVLLFAFEIFNRKALPPYQFIFLTATLMVLLFVGVTTPMIDMEAKISKLSFVLMDHPIEFKEQVLYFQSKSIIDVFNVMIHHRQLQMKFVGLLLVTFSILFPLLKMLSSLAYYYNFCQARNYRIINFFVLKSGKWSMADVLVVAIFMAFIGFNGIINNQLGDLKEAAEGVEVFTTNGTSLQPGFYLFFSYAILAMYLSGFLKSRPYECEVEEPKIQQLEEDEPVIDIAPLPNSRDNENRDYRH